MIKIILTCGIPASSKSTWARTEVAKDPSNWIRINNDDIRAMTNGSVYSSNYEKLITNIRTVMIKEGLKSNKNIIIDNLNLNPRHFEDACKFAKEANKDIQVLEKHFYIELEEAILRDSKRIGAAQVGEKVIRNWWNKSGKTQFKHYEPKVEIFQKRSTTAERFVEPMVQNESLPKAAIFDLDGTMCEISHRNPYDASTCDKDKPIEHVVNLCNLFSDNGYKIFFFSGREDTHKQMTSEWLDKHFGKEYSLHMRETGNHEDDRLLKERLFNTYIKDKFNCKAWVDDRLRVVETIHKMGLPLFRVGDPNSNF